MKSDGFAMNRTEDKTAKSSFSKLVITFFYLLIYPILLFLLAGDWRWTEGWMFSACFCLLSFATVLYLYFKDPALLNERFGSPFQKGEEKMLIGELDGYDEYMKRVRWRLIPFVF